MVDVNVSRLVDDIDPAKLSGSIAERGKNAGPETWNNAVECASDRPLEMDAGDYAETRNFFRGFGAWEDDEIDGWSHVELDALILQYAAGDLREIQSLCPGDGLGEINWKKAERLAEKGTVGGRLYAQDGQLFISLCD